MNFKTTYLHFCKLPLVIAVSSILMVACSSNSNMGNSSGVNSSHRIPVAQSEAVSSVPAGDGYSTSLLDDESLEELANLLEATDMKMVEDDKLAIQKFGNLWDRVRAGFSLNQSQYQNNQRIEAQKSWFITRQEYINRLTARASRYLYHTVREAERRNIPTELALLPVIESSYDPTGTSNAAAAGLWQFIPSTGRIYGLTQTPSYDGRRDVVESTRAAYDFLTSLYNQFGSWELALAAYNAGPGRVQKAIDANRAQGLPTDFWSLSLPTETMNYVPRFLAVAQIVKDTSKHSIYLPAIANRQHFRSVPVNYGVSLQEVARLTNVSYDELRMLNPALTNSTVDMAGPNRIIIPNEVNITLDNTLSKLSGSGSGIFTASIPDTEYKKMVKTSEGLAEFASKASAPVQNSTYIVPTPTATTYTEPPLSASEKKRIEAELATSNTLPTTSAQITKNATIVQEPPLSASEKEFISAQIKSQTSDVGEVVSSIDGNIKLDAVQTQQSILEAKGQEKRISFGATNNEDTQKSAPKPSGKRTTYTVMPGDTLINIASRAGLYWRDIADWNQINPNATLLSGTKLYLYNAKPIVPLSESAKTKDANAVNSQPNTYIVRPGDTLIGTANRVGLSVSRLASYNGLSTKADLRVGDKLWLIPGMVESSKLEAENSVSAKSDYKGDTQSYTVKRGESLIGLANSFGVSLSALAAMNDLSASEQLLVGQRLVVPANKQSDASKKATTSSSSNSKYSGKTTNYKVKAGESLIGISRKIGISVSDIAEMNNFSENTRLQRGQSIKLPVDKQRVAVVLNNESIKYKVQSGDSLIGIANKYNVALSELAAANNLSTSSQLLLGSTIVIPSADDIHSKKTDAQSKPSSKVNQTASATNLTNYTVSSGDTLIGVANRLGVSVSSLADANNLSTNSQLRIGQRLSIPNGASQSNDKSTSSSPSADYKNTYSVRSGDTLIGLAKSYDVSVSDLASANDMNTNSQLRIGQRLKVPSRVGNSSKNIPSHSTSARNSEVVRSNSSANYTVKSGDSLIGLANKYKMSVSKLAAANDLTTNAQLQIGQKIAIPATITTYRVQAGDSLIKLSKEYGISSSQLATLNGIDSNTMLQKGQVIKVPVK